MSVFSVRAAQQKRGFTLVEASASVTITVLVLGVAVGAFMFALKNANESDVQSELDIDVQLAMERLKRDLRLSSLDEIFYYPAGPGPYTALSFPLAEDSDGDGLFELDANGAIIWDKTLVYHIWPSSPHQLRVTTFTHRDNSLTDAQRQAQLEHVVVTGSGTETYNGDNASTQSVFENLLDWTISPKKGVVDTYAPQIERETTSLGFALLGDGAHTFEFRAAGKNADSSGYKIGIDQLVVSPSYSPREAEAQLPATVESGAAASAQYIAGGSWKGNHQLYFPASKPGDSFTLTMENDRWEETNFGSMGYEADNTEVVFDETMDPKDFVVKLQGNDVAWEAAMQTESSPGNLNTNLISPSSWIAVHLNGSELLTNGNWIAYNGSHCRLTFQAATNGNLKIGAAFIGKTSAQESTVFWFSSAGFEPVTFSGSPSSPSIAPGQSVTSDWVDLEINKTNNYLVVYGVDSGPDQCFPMAWTNNRTTIPDCYVDGVASGTIYGLSSLSVSYPERGTYTSQIFDTRLTRPSYAYIDWNAEIPPGTLITTKVRTGDLADLSDAADWSTISASHLNHRSISAAGKRYIQFQAQLFSSSSGLETPKLKDLTIDWAGDLQLVNITGTLTKGPDYGIVEVLADGVPLQSALSVDLMIYKDIFSLNNKTKRITSELVAEIRPRNTGK
ncbi:MAG: hypothetical protein JXR23_07960 [Pontiellaceae bacterium]|nr:hypothetical protein [Pontiellaceae bacterium]